MKLYHKKNWHTYMLSNIKRLNSMNKTNCEIKKSPKILNKMPTV